MPAFIDLTGQRFARLTALSRSTSDPKKWVFRCDCGTVKPIGSAHVKSGRIRSCGCFLNEVLHSDKHREHCAKIAQGPKTHGMSRIPIHAVWKTMIQRCTNPRSHDYRWYGALGVKICDRWREFENFYADMGEPNSLTLDRIDPAGDYEPENCRWATWETQRENKRSAHA